MFVARTYRVGDGVYLVFYMYTVHCSLIGALAILSI